MASESKNVDPGWIYLVKWANWKSTNKTVYKFGKSKNINQRLKNYYGSIIMHKKPTSNMEMVETIIKIHCKQDPTMEKAQGNEFYYAKNEVALVNRVKKCIQKYPKSIKNISNSSSSVETKMISNSNSNSSDSSNTDDNADDNKHTINITDDNADDTNNINDTSNNTDDDYTDDTDTNDYTDEDEDEDDTTCTRNLRYNSRYNLRPNPKQVVRYQP